MVKVKQKNEINLLPSNLMKNSGFLQFAQGLKTLALVGSVLLVIATFVVGSVMLINSNKINILSAKRNNLVVQVEALNEQEQQHFIIKDKTSKIVAIKSENQEVGNELNTASQIYSAFPKLALINTLNLSNKGSEVSFTSPDSKTLAQALNFLVDKNFYIKVFISSLGFSPLAGYRVDTELVSRALQL